MPRPHQKSPLYFLGIPFLSQSPFPYIVLLAFEVIGIFQRRFIPTRQQFFFMLLICYEGRFSREDESPSVLSPSPLCLQFEVGAGTLNHNDDVGGE